MFSALFGSPLSAHTLGAQPIFLAGGKRASHTRMSMYFGLYVMCYAYYFTEPLFHHSLFPFLSLFATPRRSLPSAPPPGCLWASPYGFLHPPKGKLPAPPDIPYGSLAANGSVNGQGSTIWLPPAILFSAIQTDPSQMNPRAPKWSPRPLKPEPWNEHLPNRPQH